MIRSILHHLLGALLLLAACTSCITVQSNSYLQENKKLPQYTRGEWHEYRLQPNDQLRMRVLTLDEEARDIFNAGNQNASVNNNGYTYRIYDDGTVDFPFLSGISVAGLTLREASRKVQDTLQTMVPDAMVKLAMANEQFYFVGEGKSGAYSFYKEKLNIFQALSLVGDMANNADRKRIRILRPDPNGGNPQVREFDIRSASIIDSDFYYIYPNDVIYVSSIKGDFWKIQNYSSAVGTLSTSISFLVTVINLGLSF